MLPPQIDLHIVALQLPINVSQVVLDPLFRHFNLPLMFIFSLDTLVPDGDTVGSARLGLELANDRQENHMRVPVHERFNINFHVEGEGYGILAPVPIMEELLYSVHFEVDLAVGNV